MGVWKRSTSILPNVDAVLMQSYRRRGETRTNARINNTTSYILRTTDPTKIIIIVKSANSSKSSGVDNLDPYAVQKLNRILQTNLPTSSISHYTLALFNTNIK